MYPSWLVSTSSKTAFCEGVWVCAWLAEAAANNRVQAVSESAEVHLIFIVSVLG
jgi:hypothetical protein